MPQEIPNQEALVEAVKKLELTSELFDEQNGKPKYATGLEVIITVISHFSFTIIFHSSFCEYLFRAYVISWIAFFT